MSGQFDDPAALSHEKVLLVRAGRDETVWRLGYGLDGAELECRQEQETFLISKMSIPTRGPTKPQKGTGVLIHG